MRTSSTSFIVSLATLSLLSFGCGAGTASVANSSLQGVDESGSVEEALMAGIAAGSTLRTAANLNLRSSPATNASVIRVMAKGSVVTAVTGKPSNGWFQVVHNGTTGWAYGAFLVFIAAPVAVGVGDAIDRANAGVGFSYWWGHGRFIESGPTSSTRGVCTGSCPSCSHSGSYGADCSGYIAKIWQVPATNDTLSEDAHPYSTWNFYNEQRAWTDVPTSQVKRADAFVYNASGEGHIFLYDSTDSWGNLWAYEARGCVDGVVHDLRAASSAFKAIRRVGY